MLKSMSIHLRNNKGIVKSNFVTSFLVLGAQSQHFGLTSLTLYMTWVN